MGKASSFSPGTPPKRLTAEGLPAAFPPCEAIHPSFRKGDMEWGASLSTTSSFPCLLLTSETCLYPLLVYTRSIFPLSGTYFLYPHSHSALGILVHGVNAESEILFVLKCILFFFPPSPSSSLPSLSSHQANSPASNLSCMTASLDGKLNVSRFLPLWSFSIIPLVATYSPSALCQYLVHEFSGQ